MKKRLKPAAKREKVEDLSEQFHVSLRRACRLIKFNRTTHHYKSTSKDNRVLEMRLKELAACRPRYVQRQLYELLRREGWRVNHKKVSRIYVEFGLQVRIKRKNKSASQLRVPIEKASWLDEHWSMDFVSDVMESGRRFRILTIIDHYSRESPLLAADYSLTSLKVIQYLDWLKETRGLPRVITVDNGSEFSSMLMDAWAYKNNVKLDFISPGKPVENAYIESFNGKLRDEFLNSNIFSNMQDLREKLESWSTDYNTQRPHS
ncbi:MAG: IS3 family transposase, partial [Endomicrobium sp.]|nr:IS3 family transposase [Endomicrobium sp.]